ncbi:hypothetical protein Tsubulata_014280 [Turnera subulata]|uniref:DUF1685 domain-containing protein n=1 Tax=Turnera subulata TaxID=218843 RepID=A0A9Q0FFV8_9ROSI|nr:hypothetical protein Tsubulata_014280 [Turnera subulata]
MEGAGCKQKKEGIGSTARGMTKCGKKEDRGIKRGIVSYAEPLEHASSSKTTPGDVVSSNRGCADNKDLTLCGNGPIDGGPSLSYETRPHPSPSFPSSTARSSDLRRRTTPSLGEVPMSLRRAAPPPPQSQPQRQLLPAPSPLYKQHSWSPDIYREEAWLRRKGNSKKRRSKSVTDEDLDELKGCIELGFGFDSPDTDQRLSDTLPALGLFYAVNKNYYDTVSKPGGSATATAPSSSTASECDPASPVGSPHTIFGPGDNPQTVKTRLRQWAQVVACSVRQCSSSS